MTIINVKPNTYFIEVKGLEFRLMVSLFLQQPPAKSESVLNLVWLLEWKDAWDRADGKAVTVLLFHILIVTNLGEYQDRWSSRL
jgi:hypothetical protein